MKKYVIIEDESLARDVLKRMMRAIRPDYCLAGEASSVSDAARLLQSVRPDLVLLDILLSDGNSFEIFDITGTSFPVIFTTAYDEYALKAFRLLSVDYLLKPVDEIALERALKKFESLPAPDADTIDALRRELVGSGVRNRFLTRTGENYRHIPTEAIAMFYSEDKYTFLRTFEGHDHIIDHPLDSLSKMLDPQTFFRISRSHIVNINALVKVSRHLSGRLLLSLKGDMGHQYYVARARTKEFLKWLDGLN